MKLDELSATLADFESCDWQAVIDSCSERECWAYSAALYGAAAKADRGSAKAVLAILGAVTSLDLQAADQATPFRPMGQWAGRRTADVGDFTSEQLKTLRALLPTLADPELRARVGDLLWITTRDHEAAAAAVDAYLKSASAHESPDDWTETHDRITRALNVGLSLGRGGQTYRTCIAWIEDALRRCNGEDPSFGSARMMELLLDNGEGDASFYAALAEKAAARWQSEAHWELARVYWTVASRWFAKAQQPEEQRRAACSACETYVAQAAGCSSGQGGYTLAAFHLEKAIGCFRKVGGQKDRVGELHARLLECQKESVKEMKPVSFEIEVDDLVQAAVAQVKGKSDLIEALDSLARIAGSPNKMTLEKRVRDGLQRYRLQGLFDSVLGNEQGKTIARVAGSGNLSGEGDDQTIGLRMFEEAKRHRALLAQATIEPARLQICSAHRVELRALLDVAARSPFVPPGREPLYALGLYAGLTGDWVTAAHVLLPQIEHSVRSILSARGIIVSGLDQEGIQEEFDLNRLLRSSDTAEELEKVLGADLLFDLRGLLVERVGSNLRNVVAHGLLHAGQFNSVEVCYFWWITLKLCMSAVYETNVDG